MKREQQVFLHLLSDVIHDRRSDWLKEDGRTQSDLWEKIASMAEEQSLLGFIYPQMKFVLDRKDMPSNIAEGFDSDVYLSVNRQTELISVAEQIPNVPKVLMKGMIVRRYYPHPELRSMGDVDFIIHTDDRGSSDAAMRSLGYDKFVDNHAVWTYTKREIVFEIHDHMFYERLSSDVDYVSYFDGVWEHARLSDEYPGFLEPTPEFHFLYLITHMAKHTLNKGYGFRGFLDLVFFCKAEGESLDWDWVITELMKLKLYEYTLTVFAFCRRWFDVSMPLEVVELSDAFYEEITAKTFHDGMFGLDNPENEIGNASKDSTREGLPYGLFIIKRTISELFPSYENMQLIPWYKFVDGRPWLLPAAWIYRWFYVLTHKPEEGVQVLRIPFRRKEIEARNKIVKDWRL